MQGAIEDALSTILRQPCRITGAGRTDTGVHASGQVAHFQVENPFDISRLALSLNGVLPDSVAILQVTPVHDAFHARYDAYWRRYRYRIGATPSAFENPIRWLFRPAPDLDRMNEAARRLIGKQDFDAFCRTASETKNRICEVHEADWHPEDRPGDASFVIRADRFLHGMVRAVVGTLVEIGQGKREIEDIKRILKSADRREAGFAAPSRGLTLEAVGYGASGQGNSGSRWSRPSSGE